MRNRRRNHTALSENEVVKQTAENLARNVGCDPVELRRVDIRFHNGSQWTVESRWEQLKDGQWEEIHWTMTID